MSLAPNSRFMNELDVICPVHPAGRPSPARLARSKKRAMKGTVSTYLPEQTFG